MMKKLIYMGHANSWSVYWDSQQNCFLKAKSSKLASKVRSYYFLLLLVLPFLLQGLDNLGSKGRHSSLASQSFLPLVLVACGLFVLLMIRVVWRMLYGGTEVLAASEEDIRQAIDNHIFSSFLGMKVTDKNFGRARVRAVLLIVLGLCPSVLCLLPVFLHAGGYTLGASLSLAFTIGMGLVLVIFIFWLSNPLFWLGAVEQWVNQGID